MADFVIVSISLKNRHFYFLTFHMLVALYRWLRLYDLGWHKIQQVYLRVLVNNLLQRLAASHCLLDIIPVSVRSLSTYSLPTLPL